MENAIRDLIIEQGLSDIDKDEAECIVYAWLLKTKLYLLGSSHEWSDEGNEMLQHEFKVISTYF